MKEEFIKLIGGLDEKKKKRLWKIFGKELKLKFYYLGAGDNIYLIEFYNKYQVYFDYDDSDTVIKNIERCFKYIEFKLIDEVIGGMKDE